MGYRKKYKSIQRNLDYLLKALSSDDSAFRFTDNGSESNNTLNKVKDLLAEARYKAAESERYYRILLDNVRTGVLTTDDAGNIHSTNAEAHKLIGLEILTHVNQIKKIDPSLADTLLHLNTDTSSDTYKGLETISSTAKSLRAFVESYRKFTRLSAPEKPLSTSSQCSKKLPPS